VARSVRRHFRNNVVGYVALVFALGTGVGWAATTFPKNSVGTKQLRKGAVTRAKLHKNAVNGSKVAPRSLTRSDIKIAKLGKVPSAVRADGAGFAGSALNGARRIDFHAPPVDPAPGSDAPAAHTLLTVGELTVKASCIDAGGGSPRVYVSFTSSVNGELHWSTIYYNNGAPSPYEPAEVTQLFTALSRTAGATHVDPNDDEGGVYIYRNANRTVTITLHTGSNDVAPGKCEVVGTATAAG
jgi:hypothetical protein